jgi:hypothetical protein
MSLCRFRFESKQRRYCKGGIPYFVIAGLDPAIHAAWPIWRQR